MSKGYLGMLTISIIVFIISVSSLSYILIKKPAYLKADRDGVAFYTPEVINPENNKAVSLNELIRHYKGE